MKLCTCNNCGKVFEDMNFNKSQTEYPEIDMPALIMLYPETSKPEGGYWGCPNCCTDAYLNDDISEAALSRIDLLIVNKMIGKDCTEDDSAFIKGWLRDTIIQPGTDDVEKVESIQHYFPLEYGEHSDESKLV